MDEQNVAAVEGPENNPEVQIVETVRPKTLRDYIGQANVKARIEVEMKAARNSSRVLDHIILDGPPGLGKTSMAQVIAHELGVAIKTVRCSSIKREVDLSRIIVDISEGYVLFFDEGHALRGNFAEMLYSPMEDFRFELIEEGQIDTITLPRFTVILATTSTGLLPKPFRDRFGINLHFNFYEPEELAMIVGNAAKSLGITVHEDGAFEIARRSRGTPRVALQLLSRASAFAKAHGNDFVDLSVARDTLELWSIDEQGLNELDRSMLRALLEKCGGGPVGIKTMAASISEEENVVADMEPYLMRIGLLQRTQQGRVATDFAYKYFGTEVPRRRSR